MVEGGVPLREAARHASRATSQRRTHPRCGASALHLPHCRPSRPVGPATRTGCGSSADARSSRGVGFAALDSAAIAHLPGAALVVCSVSDIGAEYSALPAPTIRKWHAGLMASHSPLRPLRITNHSEMHHPIPWTQSRCSACRAGEFALIYEIPAFSIFPARPLIRLAKAQCASGLFRSRICEF